MNDGKMREKKNSNINSNLTKDLTNNLTLGHKNIMNS